LQELELCSGCKQDFWFGVCYFVFNCENFSFRRADGALRVHIANLGASANMEGGVGLMICRISDRRHAGLIE
jgi:hypothetical protein